MSHDNFDKGDDVLIPAPYWPSYPDMVKMCGARPVIVETLAEDGYVPTDALFALYFHI